jgi:hypothetical protein
LAISIKRCAAALPPPTRSAAGRQSRRPNPSSEPLRALLREHEEAAAFVHVDQAISLQMLDAGAVFVWRSSLSQEDDVDLTDVDLALVRSIANNCPALAGTERLAFRPSQLPPCRGGSKG